MKNKEELLSEEEAEAVTGGAQAEDKVIINQIAKGGRYEWGADGPIVNDCSGLVT